MLGNLILRNSRLRRDEPAIIFEERTVSHGQFAARSFQLVRALQHLGLGVGDRLAILAQNCPEYMEVYAAGELGGWATVTINYRLAEPEVVLQGRPLTRSPAAMRPTAGLGRLGRTPQAGGGGTFARAQLPSLGATHASALPGGGGFVGFVGLLPPTPGGTTPKRPAHPAHLAARCTRSASRG